MGYYTEYTVSVVKGEISDDELEDLLSQFSLYSWEGSLTKEVKWYTHEEDMLKISRKRPDLILRVVGFGENRDDNWVEYYENGEMYRESIPIVIPPCTWL